MNDQLLHRGPDDAGVYCAAGASMGMRRLSIIDLAGGRQPMSNETGDQWLVFNGEIYNHLELRRDLKRRGHQFSTKSDTEVIVHLFEELGREAPKSLRGDFAFAIWDEKARRGFLARDHVGVKPLFYTVAQDRLIFASELKALIEDGRLSLEIDPVALDLYLTFLYIPAPWTIYKNIFKLPPGSLLEFHGGEYQISQYWKPPTDQQLGSERRDLDQRIYQRMKESVAIRLMSDVPLGVFLSGGLDSSAIVSLMSEVSSSPITTFSVGYGEAFSSFDEISFGRSVAQSFGTEHVELMVKPDIEETIRKVVDVLDEPFGDSSALPTYLISEQTAGSVKVALSGVGADELFGGYQRYLGMVWNNKYAALPLPLRKIFATLAPRNPPGHSSRNVWGWLSRFLASPESSSFERYQLWMSFNEKQERKALYHQDWLAGHSSLEQDHHYLERIARNVEFQDPVDQALYTDLLSYLPNDLLFIADHMGMANSLEIRVPFCDHLLLEELIRLPWKEKMGIFTLKAIPKRILKDRLPASIVRRKKQGFMIPIGEWMRHELQPLFSRYLSPERLNRQGVFSADTVGRLFEEHLSGRIVRTNQVWGLFVFQLWYEKMGGRLTGT